MVPDLVAGVAGFVLLSLTYLGVEYQWPATYRSLSNTFDLVVRERLWRMIAFRSVPVFVWTVLTWTVAHQLGGTGWLAVTISVVLHVLSTNGRAFLRSQNSSRPESLVNYGTYHLLASAIAAGSGVAGSALAPSLRDFVPRPAAMLEAVWTALFVALVAAVVLRATAGEEGDRDASSPRYRYERAVRDAGVTVFDLMFAHSSKAGTDPLFTRAAAVSEILQRPSWFRRAERLFGLIRPRGTYGVMQVLAARPLTDEQSIMRFCEQNVGPPSFTVLEDSEVEVRANDVWFKSGRHNGDLEFIEAVQSLYDWFVANIDWVHLESSFGSIGILEKRQYSTTLGLRIATTSEVVEVRRDGREPAVIYERPQLSVPGSWWYFEHSCPMSEERLWITEGGQERQRLVELAKTGYFV